MNLAMLPQCSPSTVYLVTGSSISMSLNLSRSKRYEEPLISPASARREASSGPITSPRYNSTKVPLSSCSGQRRP